MQGTDTCDCYQCLTERELDKVEKNTQHLFCDACNGKGKVYDSTVLLRWETCKACRGVS
jgi:hypothetical protein